MWWVRLAVALTVTVIHLTVWNETIRHRWWRIAVAHTLRIGVTGRGVWLWWRSIHGLLIIWVKVHVGWPVLPGWLTGMIELPFVGWRRLTEMRVIHTIVTVLLWNSLVALLAIHRCDGLPRHVLALRVSIVVSLHRNRSRSLFARPIRVGGEILTGITTVVHVWRGVALHRWVPRLLGRLSGVRPIGSRRRHVHLLLRHVRDRIKVLCWRSGGVHGVRGMGIDRPVLAWQRVVRMRRRWLRVVTVWRRGSLRRMLPKGYVMVVARIRVLIHERQLSFGHVAVWHGGGLHL